MSLSCCSWIVHFLLLLCLLHAQFWTRICASDGDCSSEELQSLLQFRRGLIDPDNLLSSWRGHNCCYWRGLSCDNRTASVISIDLHNRYANASDPRYDLWNLSGRVDHSLLQLKFLSHLDLSYNNFNGLQIPSFIGYLKRLKYLNLSNAGFAGTIPFNVGNLSELQYLDLSSSFQLRQWVTGLSSLRHLKMSGVDLSKIGSDWVRAVNGIPSLTLLDFRACGLSGIAHSISPVNFSSLAFLDLSLNSFNSEIPYWFSNLSSLVHLDMMSAGFYGSIPVELSATPSLRYLDLSMNGNLTVDASTLLRGKWRQIEVLRLASNQIYGRLPDSIGNISSLIELDLLSNNIEGGIPSSIGKLFNLQILELRGNNLTLDLPLYLIKHPLPQLRSLSLAGNKLSGTLPGWLGELANLETLDLSYNSIRGSIPSSISKLPFLTTLDLSGNQLDGTLPYSIGQLTKLHLLGLSSNHLTGTITERHFEKLNDLKFLLLGFNSLTVNISSGWTPPFQVQNLGLGSCQLDQFPYWLQTQKELKFLDLSNSTISGELPTWFWDLTSNLSLLNISFNLIEGELPKLLNINAYADVDIRSNLFSGPLPVFSNFVELLDLSNNQFSGTIPGDIAELQPYIISLSLSNNNLSGEIPNSIGLMQELGVLDLSRNNLSGQIPGSLSSCSNLKALVLEHNSITGTIPPSLGSLKQLQSLHLSNNLLHGVIPPSLKNMSDLQTLDLGYNNLEGAIPEWLGESFPALRILRLRANKLSGRISNGLSNLSSLQVLDIAGNDLEGQIPSSLGSLRAMAIQQRANQYIHQGFYRGTYYSESLSMMINNMQRVFTKTLSLLVSIDLSDNNLSGEVPGELMDLSGLLVLNLARNQLHGEVLQQISDLHELLSLDLSNNRFNGSIPASMASMTFLGYLNLSNNNFSGRVADAGQLGRFDPSAYSGNPLLCGAPLNVACEDDEPTGKSDGIVDGSESILEDEGFYMSLGVGFASGLLGLFGVLSIRKTWSAAYFNLVDSILDWISKVKNMFPGFTDRRRRSRKARTRK
ncbi:receptor-like protein EIX2 [Curcuma longa]|uniref:receptor-like protein EIX2 n=1 Tax=Curcuma longa TaxID=136217 RepID=UPI003D9E13EF